jgi:hypothetical protein
MGKKKASYTAEFKLKVILYADENGKLAAAWQFDMDLKCVQSKKKSFFQKDLYMAVQQVY